MTHPDTTPFDDLLDPLRDAGWTAELVDGHLMRLAHPALGEIELDSRSSDDLRRLLASGPFAGRVTEALRRAPTDRPDDLTAVRDIIRVCRPFSSNPRLPSAVLGVLADRGLVDDGTYEWFHGHADVLVDPWSS